MSIRAEFARFAMVGAVGFVVDALALQVLVAAFDWSPFAARAVSFPLAVTATFALNRLWTFRRPLRTSALHAYGAYGLIQTTGALINLSVFSLCLLAVRGMREKPVAALAAGAVVAMLFNFLASRFAVFHGRR